MGKALRTLIIFAACAIAPCSPAAGPWRADAGNTRGWQFMTAEERLAHQARIRAFDDYDTCRAYQVEHHRSMAARAKQQGRDLGPEQRDFCEHLQPVARTH